VSARANPHGIEPALLGTRFGAALEAAAEDHKARRWREERLRAEWLDAHPECLSTKPVYPLVQEKKPGPVDPETAMQWARVLSRLSPTEYGSIKGQMADVRKALLAHGLMEWRVVSGRFQYRRSQAGTKWLETQQAAYQQSLNNQVSEDVTGEN
jgi:hypothetical protein